MEDFLSSRPSFYSYHKSEVCLIDFINDFKSHSIYFCVNTGILSISDCITVCAIERGPDHKNMKLASLKKWAEDHVDKSDICIWFNSFKCAKQGP